MDFDAKVESISDETEKIRQEVNLPAAALGQAKYIRIDFSFNGKEGARTGIVQLLFEGNSFEKNKGLIPKPGSLIKIRAKKFIVTSFEAILPGLEKFVNLVKVNKP